MAATTRGCACPVLLTARPAMKSRYALPETSHTRAPCPWSSASAGVPYVGASDASQRALRSTSALREDGARGVARREALQADVVEHAHALDTRVERVERAADLGHHAA